MVDHQQKFITHCEELSGKKQFSTFQSFTSSVILIGPEGEFTKGEISLALKNNFIPVSLGETRVRTETAGIVVSTLLLLNRSGH